MGVKIKALYSLCYSFIMYSEVAHRIAVATRESRLRTLTFPQDFPCSVTTRGLLLTHLRRLEGSCANNIFSDFLQA